MLEKINRGIGEGVYCFCLQGDNGLLMIQCDCCLEWYHGRCVGLTKTKAANMGVFHCQECKGEMV